MSDFANSVIPARVLDEYKATLVPQGMWWIHVYTPRRPRRDLPKQQVVGHAGDIEPRTQIENRVHSPKTRYRFVDDH